MVKWTSVRALEAEKTTKTKWILNCGTPCMWWVLSLYLTVWSDLQSVHTHICTDSQFQNNFKCGHTSYQQICFLVIWILVQFQKCLSVLYVICNVQIMDKINSCKWCNTLLLASYWINLIFSCLAFHLSIMHTYFYISWYQPG